MFPPSREERSVLSLTAKLPKSGRCDRFYIESSATRGVNLALFRARFHNYSWPRCILQAQYDSGILHRVLPAWASLWPWNCSSLRGSFEFSEDVEMASETKDKLSELLADFDSAMLVTRTSAGELRSRPMAVADLEESGELLIAADSHVNVAMQASRKFVSISGTAVAVDDRRKVAELWNEAWKVWFPGGKDDPTLILLKVHVDRGEYWDNSGMSGIKYLIEAGKAYLSGTKPDVAGDPKVHGKVVG
jgi:general stress protein 26